MSCSIAEYRWFNSILIITVEERTIYFELDRMSTPNSELISHFYDIKLYLGWI